ncbi:T9SS type A sorting domain-containing protein [bacterium]|nr:T9SS type A sorting domain-containing protein [bacterium]
MKKLILSLLLVVLCMSLFATEKGDRPAGLSGAGTSDNPYLVEDFLDLVILSSTNSYWASGTYIQQTGNIDASDSSTLNSGAGFLPIANFQGVYDGNNYYISNLFISRSSGYQALFGTCNNAIIKNLGLEDCQITGTFNTGALVGEAQFSSSIENCYTTGSVTGENYTGGLIGHINSQTSVENTYSECSVNGTGSVGGLIGNCKENTSVSKSYATGNVQGSTSSIGGLIGYVYKMTSISECFATGDVEGDEYVGGLCGYTSGTSTSNRLPVNNCFASGDVTGSNYTGAIFGRIHKANINKCYSIGSVSCSGTYVGGFTGYNTYADCFDSFWNTTTAGVATSPIATGKTTEELQTLSTYTNSGWDFVDESANGENDYWALNSEINDGFPYLTFSEDAFIESIEVPHVTNNIPSEGQQNIGLSPTFYWTQIPELAGYSRGYEITFEDNYITTVSEVRQAVLGDTLEYTSQYSYSVKAFYQEDGTENKFYPATDPTTISFYTKPGLAPETINEDNPIEDIYIDLPWDFPAGVLPNEPEILATLPIEGFAYQPVAAVRYNFTHAGIYGIYITVADFTDGHVYVGETELEEFMEWGTNANGIWLMYDYDGSKGSKDIVVTNNDDFTLPVELSSFNAIATADNFAQISWETASESNLLGYNIYRSETENQEDALRVTATMIIASNQAMGDSYSYTDDEVEMNTTYNYWLQANDFDGTNQMFGPVTIKISDQEDNDIDNIVLGSQLYGNYPNPFNPETTISYSISNPQHVRLEVYNMKGQLVKTLLNKQVETANTRLNVIWNGKDNNNNDVSSGIYLYKLVTDNYSKTNKMILMK